MQVKLCELGTKARFGIVGHAGCGHSNSHCGFVQDDSGGLAAVLCILKRALPEVDLRIASVDVKTGVQGGFTVRTVAGGEATAYARRGVTPYEAELSQRVVGKEAVCTQALSMYAFGRTLGQGAMEVPVALQTAIANAALESFRLKFPQYFVCGKEEIEGNIGCQLGCVLDVDGIPVSLLGVVNATAGGLGPNEDLEGNVNLGGKAEMMRQLGLDRLPTILVEGKVCAAPVSPVINEPTFVTRAYVGDDNVTVSECLEAAAQDLGYPIVYPRELLARKAGAMRELTQRMGENIMELGNALAKATKSGEKVRIAAELNRFVSQELGGVTFMSDDIHEVMGGVGAIPGTTGCLSLFISNEELNKVVYPSLTLQDVGRFADVILQAVGKLAKREQEALREVDAARQRANGHGLTAR